GGALQACCAIIISNGNIWSNNSNTGKTLGGFVGGNILSVAVDIPSLRGWLRRNGGNWNGDPTADPATGVGGVTIASGSWEPAIALSGTDTSADGATYNFGASAFTYAVPSSFKAGWW